ncbi:hypothetical protein [Saccharothrix syringae]|uniref:hypothetical protein n=1 Tax=Saccharothrix syringae TaxID=103733 RepID=UPI00068A5EAD
MDGLYRWRHPITPTRPGDVAFRIRAWFDQVAEPLPSEVRTPHVGTPAEPTPVSCPCRLNSCHLPPQDVDRLPVEPGQRFSVDRPGRISGLVFTRGAYQGAVTARRSAGTLPSAGGAGLSVEAVGGGFGGVAGVGGLVADADRRAGGDGGVVGGVARGDLPAQPLTGAVPVLVMARSAVRPVFQALTVTATRHVPPGRGSLVVVGRVSWNWVKDLHTSAGTHVLVPLSPPAPSCGAAM